MSKIEDLLSFAIKSHGMPSGKMNNLQQEDIQLNLFEKPRSDDWMSRFLNSEFTFNPGVILLKKLVRLYHKDQLPPYKHIGVRGAILAAIIEDKRKLDYRIAAKVAIIFQTSPQYWIDIQSRYDVLKFIKDYPFRDDLIYDTLSEYIKLINRRPKLYASSERYVHPGKILLNEFIHPSGLTLKDWQHILLLSAKSFRGIIEGKREMPIEVIVKLCRILKIDVHFWLENQNRFYAAKCDQG